MITIFDNQEQYEAILRARTRNLRATLIASGHIYPLEARPTLRLRAQDEKHVTRHIHEGAWTLGMYEDDLPGFEPDEVHP